MQEKINLQKIKEICSKMRLIDCPYGTCYLEDYINCTKGEGGQNETYEDIETTWGYKSMDFINLSNKDEL